MHVRSNGINAIGIDQGDELVAARITDGNQIVFLASHEGMAVRFDESHVRPMGRSAYGVRGIDLAKGDYVVGMATTVKPGAVATTEHVGTAASAVPGTSVPEPEAIDVAVKGDLILSVTENGFGKRTPADEYRLINRGGKGVINVKTTERVGKVVAIAQVDETSEVMLISHYGKIIRMDSTTIRESGRNAQGVRLLQMEPGDRVAAAVVIAPEAEPNGGNGGTLIQ
jgi:DNA gyrase subunit A